MVVAADPALEVLLASREPAIRHAALTELLGRPTSDPEVAAAHAAGRQWKPPGSVGGNVEVVDWGKVGPASH